MTGIGPAAIAETSLWRFRAMAEGYRRAHMTEAERAKELSEDEFDALAEWLDE